jgi:hypothetical protein
MTLAAPLIQALSETLAGPAFSIAPEEVLHLTIGGQPLSFLLVEDDGDEILFVSSPLGSLPPAKQPARWRVVQALMQDNLQWQGTDGGALALETETDVVFLQKRWFLTLPPAPTAFVDEIARFLLIARRWTDRLTAARTAEAVPDFALKV